MGARVGGGCRHLNVWASSKRHIWRLANGRGFRLYERAWYRTAPKRVHGSRRGILLIPPPGGGNIGDQAMFESFLRNTSGPVTVIMPSEGALSVPSDLEERVSVHVLHDLFQGRPQLTPHLIYRFARLLARSRYLIVIGADILDGSYGLRPAWARTEAMQLANRLGVPCRVIGFSWSDEPHREIEAAYRRLSNRVELHVRDKYSARRLAQAGISTSTVPDTVFALRPPISQPSQRCRKAQAIALLNISGLLKGRGIAPEQYVGIVAALRQRGYRVVLLPHVFRDADDDLSAARELHRLLSGDDIEIVSRPMTPAQVQMLASEAKLVITGRMHLAVLALTVGTPAIVFGSQGKVEGMLALFDLEEFAVDPSSGFDSATIELLEHLELHGQEIRAGIAEALPRVVEQAERNFVLSG